MAASRSAAAPSARRSVTVSPVASLIQGVARQPEAQGQLQTLFFLTVGLVEAMYFINLAFAVLFVFVLGQVNSARTTTVAATSNFLIPNATFIAELVAFVIILWIIAKYILPPIRKAMTDRQAMITQAGRGQRGGQAASWPRPSGPTRTP